MWLLFIYSFILHNSQNNNFYFSVISTTQNTLTFKFFYQGSHSFFFSPLSHLQSCGLWELFISEKRDSGWTGAHKSNIRNTHKFSFSREQLFPEIVSPLQRCSLEQLCVFQKVNYRQKPMKGDDSWPEKVTSSQLKNLIYLENIILWKY